jgi:predicted TIM-barrel fold metal-dependent hydrolase
MSMAGVDVGVSSSGSLGVDALPLAEARELAHLLNEERAEAERRYLGRFLGLATIPMQDPEAAVAVLRDAVGRLGLRGVCICSNVNGQALSSDELRPVYGAIQELQIPLFIHPTKTVMEQNLRRYALEFSVGYMFDTTVAALDLVFGGIVEEFPDIPIVHPHLGGTIPFLAKRIDQHEDIRVDGERLRRSPSEYLRGFYTDTALAQTPTALQLASEFYGVERIVFGSDYPFWSLKDGIEFVRANFDGDERELVMSGTASRVLGLEKALPK